jgi:demethoxyubiquinone hydroxylase (CLK1/Coq7/Cat5 family)
MANAGDIDTLNSFLRGELSAVETYRQASKHIKGDLAKTEVETNLRDHEQRVAAIQDRIRELGGKPAEGSGLWGAFAKAVQGTADLLGDKLAIDALEQGEDHGLADYNRDIDKLHGAARTFARSQLLPAQKQTHDRLSKLKHNPNLH